MFQQIRPAAPPPVTRTRRLLAGGAIAGPLFVGAVLAQALTRDGFDLGRHPLSLLSLGELGWIQIANFVVTGVLYLACAVGLRRVLHPGRGGTWGPRLIGGVGAGLILSGVFLADAGAGYPPGAPAGAPEMSWHGALHELGFFLAFIGLIAGCLVLARGFAARVGRGGRSGRGWSVAGLATVVTAVVVTAWPDLDSISVRLVIASAVLFGFVAALAARAARGVPEQADRRTGDSPPSDRQVGRLVGDRPAS